jgi:putative hydrolase of the HAD superfamily
VASERSGPGGGRPGHLREVTPTPAQTSERPGRYRGLLIDYGGVLTTNLFDSFRAFCEREGLAPDVIVRQFRGNTEARELLIELETGRMEEREFEERLAGLLGVDSTNLIDRLFAGSQPDQPMLAAVRTARQGGIRTGLISNSWGTHRYDRAQLSELFDGVVISGEVGMRKPAAQMYSLGAESIGLPSGDCVFVDDLPFNLVPAAELGMATVHHVSAERTIAELERLLGIALT